MIMLAANFIWHGLPVDVVVPAGDRPKKKALDWLMQFSSEKRRLLIYQVEETGLLSVHRPFKPRLPNASGVAKNHGQTGRVPAFLACGALSLVVSDKYPHVWQQCSNMAPLTHVPFL